MPGGRGLTAPLCETILKGLLKDVNCVIDEVVVRGCEGMAKGSCRRDEGTLKV